MINFTWKEVIHSDRAKKAGISNNPDTKDMDNIMLSIVGMQQVRNFLGVPLKVNSWYRNEQVNKLVGGVPNSYHRQGLAIDFRPLNGMTIKQAFDKIAKSGIKFDKVIHEKDGGAEWIHIQFSKTPRQIVTQIFK